MDESTETSTHILQGRKERNVKCCSKLSLLKWIWFSEQLDHHLDRNFWVVCSSTLLKSYRERWLMVIWVLKQLPLWFPLTKENNVFFFVFPLQQGEVLVCGGPKFTLWITLKNTWEGENAVSFDFFYVLEIASSLQLARCSVWACVYFNR